jgi:hypothetical protein
MLLWRYGWIAAVQTCRLVKGGGAVVPMHTLHLRVVPSSAECLCPILNDKFEASAPYAFPTSMESGIKH